jgi:hypothetical protein
MFHTLFSIADPYILHIIFLSNILSTISSATVSVHVSAPYIATGLINVLCTCILRVLDIMMI